VGGRQRGVAVAALPFMSATAEPCARFRQIARLRSLLSPRQSSGCPALRGRHPARLHRRWGHAWGSRALPTGRGPRDALGRGSGQGALAHFDQTNPSGI